jgi:hypothetical protein
MVVRVDVVSGIKEVDAYLVVKGWSLSQSSLKKPRWQDRLCTT